MAGRDDAEGDITQGVGATALGVAWARANESSRPDALFRDPWAAIFLDAAQARGWRLPAGPMAERIRSIGDYAASRTRWFDDFFTAAAADGIRQAVILGAGLDARAQRLTWAEDTTVYEIDQPAVLQFKAEALAAHATPSTSRRVTVPIDLRQDWPEALRSAGFEPSVPTAWSAEGLLPYLPAQAQDTLFERITALSAPESRIAVEAFGRDFFDPEHLAMRREQMRRLREESGVDRDEAPDVQDLWFVEERADVATWLTDHGWAASSIDWRELLQRYRSGSTQNAPRTAYVSGTHQSTSSS